MTNPKRFLVFAFSHSYPRGGWDDLQSSFDTKEEAVKFVIEFKAGPGQNLAKDKFQVVDLETGHTWRGPLH